MIFQEGFVFQRFPWYFCLILGAILTAFLMILVTVLIFITEGKIGVIDSAEKLFGVLDFMLPFYLIAAPVPLFGLTLAIWFTSFTKHRRVTNK